jgi:carbonic anhydrase/acetyltransferase-like protein (isoleucine patch superfamily)
MVEYGQMETDYHRDLVHAMAFIAPNATIIGHVSIGAEASIWYGCVVRGDDAPIHIGPRANIQDLTVIHADAGQPCVVESGATIGHRAVLHSATIGAGALVGIGAIVLNGARVGERALVGAGALVTEGTVIPPRHLVLGVPGRVVRPLTDEELTRLQEVADHYVVRARTLRETLGGSERR